MVDRGSSYNRRLKRSSSSEEDEFSVAQDRQNSSLSHNLLENVQAKFSSFASSVSSRIKGEENSGSSRGGRRDASDRAVQEERSMRSDRVVRDERSMRSGRRRSERTVRDSREREPFQSREWDQESRSGQQIRDVRRTRGVQQTQGEQQTHRVRQTRRFEGRDNTRQSSRQERGFDRDLSLSRAREPRHAALVDGSQRQGRSADLSQRHGRSTSFRESYGRASDYARHADNDFYQDYELGEGYYSRSRRDSRFDYDDGYYDEREFGYSANDKYGFRSESHSSRRGRHSEPEVYVKSGQRRGIFNGGLPLPFGMGGRGHSFHGGHAAGGSFAGGSFLSSLSLPVLYALPVVVLILIIVLLVFVVSSVQSCTAGTQNDQVEVQEVQPMNLSYQASVTGLDSVADSGTTIAGFTLANEGQNYVPALSEEGANSIQSALSPFTENEYDIGFLMMDLQTGSGYAYNIDQEVYGASSFKGPVLIYGCQEALEPGILSIDTVNDSASNAITYSDNRSYYNMRALFEEYSEISLTSWLANMNIDSDVESDTSFPHYSARESAKLWMNAYLYFTSSESDSEIVSWAQDLFSQTEVSMLRAGVDPTFPLVTDSGEVYISQTDQSNQSNGQDNQANQSSDQGGTGEGSGENQTGDSGNQSGDQGSESGDSNGDQAGQSGSEDGSSGLSAADMATSGSGVVVYDKAGWLNGETDDGLCDAGIIYDGDKAYLLSIMSGAPDGDGTREDMARLVAALWGQRSTLAPSQGYVLVDPAQATNQEGSTEGQ